MLFKKKELIEGMMDIPQLYSLHSIYYSIVQEDWYVLTDERNWKKVMKFIEMVSLHQDSVFELCPPEITMKAIPFCLSLVYLVCMLLKKGKIEKMVQLWNEVNRSHADQCQAL